MKGAPLQTLSWPESLTLLLTRYDRVHVWEAVAELTSFSVCLFVLTNAAIDGGAVLCPMTYLSQEVL